MSKTKFVAPPGKQEIIMERFFEAAPERVFAAYTDPKLIAQWWGPRAYTTKIEKLEAKAGGMWRFIQSDKAGHEFGFHGVFHEALANRRIVQTFEFEGAPGHVMLTTITFEATDGGTKLSSISVFQTLEARDGMMQAGAEGGAVEGWNRLEELLKRG